MWKTYAQSLTIHELMAFASKRRQIMLCIYTRYKSTDRWVRRWWEEGGEPRIKMFVFTSQLHKKMMYVKYTLWYIHIKYYFIIILCNCVYESSLSRGSRRVSTSCILYLYLNTYILYIYARILRCVLYVYNNNCVCFHPLRHV